MEILLRYVIMAQSNPMYFKRNYVVSVETQSTPLYLQYHCQNKKVAFFFGYSRIRFNWQIMQDLGDQFILDAPDCFGYLLRGIQKLN